MTALKLAIMCDVALICAANDILTLCMLYTLASWDVQVTD